MRSQFLKEQELLERIFKKNTRRSSIDNRVFIHNFVDIIEEWIESYACIGEKKLQEMYRRIAGILRGTANQQAFEEEEFRFEISEERMSYHDALSFCWLKDMWLAEFDEENGETIRQNVSYLSFRFS